MIQPTLTSYTLDAPPGPVLLDSISIRADAILLLDSFFYIVVFHGESVAAWRNENYQNLPEYESFKLMLEAPKEDARVRIVGDF